MSFCFWNITGFDAFLCRHDRGGCGRAGSRPWRHCGTGQGRLLDPGTLCSFCRALAQVLIGRRGFVLSHGPVPSPAAVSLTCHDRHVSSTCLFDVALAFAGAGLGWSRHPGFTILVSEMGFFFCFFATPAPCSSLWFVFWWLHGGHKGVVS